MILQAESKKEYEEVSFKSAPCSRVLEAGRVNTGELSGMICVVVIFWTCAWKHLSQPVSVCPTAPVRATGSPNVHSLLFHSGFALSTTSPDRST